MSTRLTRLFAIRPGEEAKTLLLLSLHFVFYVGLRWGENASETLFIHAWGAQDLSLVFIGNAILSFCMVLVFTFFADRVSNERLLAGMVVVMAAWLASVWVLLGIAGGARGAVYPYFYLVYTAFGEMATLNILNYINDFYDTRAAKRALPLMLSGAVAGSTVAGFSAPLINSALGVQNVPLAWMTCLGVTLALIVVIQRRLGHEASDLRRTAQKQSRGSGQNLRDGLKFVRESGLLRWLAIATFAVILLLRFLAFQANVVFAAQFKGDPEGLFNFYGVLGGASNLLGLTIQSLLLGRLVSQFGVAAANLIFPSLTLIAVSGLYALPGLATAVFGRLDHTSLKQALRNPLDAMLINAVPLQIKGRARGFIKLVAPIATLVAGLTLLAVQVGNLPPLYLPLTAIIIALIYLIASFRVNREYTRSLAGLLADDAMSVFRSSSDSSRDEFEKPDPATLSLLHKRLHESQSDEMTVFMAEMIYEIEGRESLQHMQRLVRERGPQVRANVIRMLGADLTAADAMVRALCLEGLKDEDATVRREAANALATAPGIERDERALKALVSLLNDADESVQAEAIPTLVASRNPVYVLPAEQKIAGWLESNGDNRRRSLGLGVLSRTGDKRLIETLAGYLIDRSAALRRQSAELIGELAQRAADEQVRKHSVETLRPLLKDEDEGVRFAAVEAIGRLDTADSNRALTAAFSDQSFEVRRLATRLTEPNAKRELESALASEDPHAAECAAFVLARARHLRARRYAVELMERFVGDAYKLNVQRLSLQDIETTGARLLKTTLQEQAAQLLDRVFWLLGSLGSEEEAQNIRRALMSGAAVARANATETLEAMTTPRLAMLVAPLFDGTPLEALAKIGKEAFSISLPTQGEVLCQAWPQLCHASGGTTNRNLTLIYNDGWLSAATMLTLLEMDAKAIDGLQGASVEEVRGALRATLDEGAPLAQETARRMLAQVDAGSGQEAGQKAMLTTIEKVIFLKEVPFFQGMTIDQLRVLASISEELVCAEGQKIFAEGEYGDALYVVISGQVAIQRQTKRGSRTSITRLATLGPREYFAEMSIFDNEPYSADAVALKPVELLLVRQNTLVGLIRHQPDLALSLLKELSRRLRKANDQIAEKTQAKPKQLMDLYDKF